MVNRGNKKLYAALFVMAGIFTLLFVIDHWLNQQLDETKQDKVQGAVELSSPNTEMETQDRRHGIPQIDPDHDPLAPVVKKSKPSPESNEEQSASSEAKSKRVYEFPQKGTIFLQ